MKTTIYVYVFCFLLLACANPVAPTGGEKDVTPPELFLVQPKNEQTNYHGDRIEFWFKEYISYSGGSEKLVITPAFPKPPEVKVKGKKLIVMLPDSLQENTTYTISFLEAIKDFTEGNTINFLKYVFSTGDFIDSASISGMVVDAYNNKALENVIVGLHKKTDSFDLSENRPIYLSQTDAGGNFVIDHVREGSYVISAIEDKNLNFVLDRNNERASLLTNEVYITNESVLEQTIKVFSNEGKALVNDYKVLGNNKLYITFNQELETIFLDGDSLLDKDVAYFGSNNDTLYYHWSNAALKSHTFYFNLNGNSLDTLIVPIGKNVVEDRLVVENSRVLAGDSIVILCPFIISSYNKNMISLSDTLGQELDWKAKVNLDKFIFYLKAREGDNVVVKIDSAAFEYFTGDFSTQYYEKEVGFIEKEVLSSLILRLNSNNINPLVLQLLNEEGVQLAKYDITGLKSFTLTNQQEGNYYIRVFQDNNRDFKWTTGSMELLREAEPTLFYSPLIEIKANWDKEMTLSF